MDNYIFPLSSGGGGTEVIANPTLAGTEADLTGLQIGDTKYAIPSGGGGGSIYAHYINLFFDYRQRLYFSILSDSATPLSTVADIASVLYNHGFIDSSNSTICSGMYYQTSNSQWYSSNAIISDDGSSLTIIGVRTAMTNGSYVIALESIPTITDKVVQIL